MTAREIETVFDGCAFMGYCCGLYESMGNRDEQGRYGFADINDGSPLYLMWETLLSDACELYGLDEVD